jgi:DNA-binding ferritin-like protein (Dps family)
MKKLVEVTEVNGEGLVKLIGERVTLFCANYVYTGKLIGVNDDCVLLSDCGIVYETGSFTESKWKDYQKLPNEFYVMKQSIESFGLLK